MSHGWDVVSTGWLNVASEAQAPLLSAPTQSRNVSHDDQYLRIAHLPRRAKRAPKSLHRNAHLGSRVADGLEVGGMTGVPGNRSVPAPSIARLVMPVQPPRPACATGRGVLSNHAVSTLACHPRPKLAHALSQLAKRFALRMIEGNLLDGVEVGGADEEAAGVPAGAWEVAGGAEGVLPGAAAHRRQRIKH
jgi:hypothetical protein